MSNTITCPNTLTNCGEHTCNDQCKPDEKAHYCTECKMKFLVKTEEERTLESIRARHAAATRGPWRWFGYVRGRGIQYSKAKKRRVENLHLATTHSGRLFIMTFERSGMRDAQPMFQAYRENRKYGFMEPAGELAECKEYSGELLGINNPDAIAIERSWEDIEFLLQRIGKLEAELDALREWARRFGNFIRGNNIWGGVPWLESLEQIIKGNPSVQTQAELVRGIDFEIDANGTPKQIGVRFPSRTEQISGEHDFTHEDYTRSLVSWRTGIEVPENERAAALDLEKRMRLWLHQAKFGCVPRNCPQCQDPEYVKRVLNCDDDGNPNDG